MALTCPVSMGITSHNSPLNIIDIIQR